MEHETWIAQAEAIKEQVVEWRRHFHRHPELSFQEVQTSAYIEEQLRGFGNLQISRPTPTSVMARLKGEQPGRVLALRADIDALPIHEENQFEFASQTDNVMHACGHDSHASILLGVAKILSGEKQSIRGEVRFIFQHAEEQVPGGAGQLVEAGVMDNVDAIFALHLISWLDTGKIGLLAGPVMAGNDAFDITITGSGGHAAYPHQAIDAISVAAQVIVNLQHVVARHIDPLCPAVLSLTQIHGGSGYNSFPEQVKLGGTFRSFDQSERNRMPGLIHQIIDGVATAHGATCELDYQPGYRPLYNDTKLVEFVREAAVDYFGADVLEQIQPTLGAEDFSAYLRKAPGAFIYIGSRNGAKESDFPHHHPRFTVDEDAMETGLKMLLLLVDRWQNTQNLLD
ncbi:amidohydrolase [Paenibacillus sp. 23TSA30-6]|uniref:amidohydrolase n=1 Tax=Paenibacillus sp. 23TSA30-6 TaxID=2546104 RepID=UPI001787F4C7|nr:amidohydrolase [Paenibacillus sp. 23TSA30-6]MBE0335921.1 amidohydrolase [Paenibacillus sp. 23TSA30-6]